MRETPSGYADSPTGASSSWRKVKDSNPHACRHGPAFETGCRPIGATFRESSCSDFLLLLVWRDRRESNPHYRRDKPACWPLHHDPDQFLVERPGIGPGGSLRTTGLQPVPAPYRSTAPLVEPPGLAPGPRGCEPRTLRYATAPHCWASWRRAQKNPAMPGFPRSDGIQGYPVTGATPRTDNVALGCASSPVRQSFDLGSTCFQSLLPGFVFVIQRA